MRLAFIKDACGVTVHGKIFESEAAIRTAIARGALVHGRHYFQAKHGGRIRLDLDAIVEDITRPAPLAPANTIPCARGGFVRIPTARDVAGSGSQAVLNRLRAARR